MKQIVNNFKSGILQLVEVPPPMCREGGIIIKTKNSVVSIGTEKMMIDLAKKSLLGKAKERPDQVQQVIQKVKNEGLIPTYKKIMNLKETKEVIDIKTQMIDLNYEQIASISMWCISLLEQKINNLLQ